MKVNMPLRRRNYWRDLGEKSSDEVEEDPSENHPRPYLLGCDLRGVVQLLPGKLVQSCLSRFCPLSFNIALLTLHN